MRWLEARIKTVAIEAESEKDRKKSMVLWDLCQRREPVGDNASTTPPIPKDTAPTTGTALKSKEEAEAGGSQEAAGGAISRRTAKIARSEFELCYATTPGTNRTPTLPTDASTNRVELKELASYSKELLVRPSAFTSTGVEGESEAKSRRTCSLERLLDEALKAPRALIESPTRTPEETQAIVDSYREKAQRMSRGTCPLPYFEDLAGIRLETGGNGIRIEEIRMASVRLHKRGEPERRVDSVRRGERREQPDGGEAELVVVDPAVTTQRVLPGMVPIEGY